MKEKNKGCVVILDESGHPAGMGDGGLSSTCGFIFGSTMEHPPY